MVTLIVKPIISSSSPSFEDRKTSRRKNLAQMSSETTVNSSKIGISAKIKKINKDLGISLSPITVPSNESHKNERPIPTLTDEDNSVFGLNLNESNCEIPNHAYTGDERKQSLLDHISNLSGTNIQILTGSNKTTVSETKDASHTKSEVSVVEMESEDRGKHTNNVRSDCNELPKKSSRRIAERKVRETLEANWYFVKMPPNAKAGKNSCIVLPDLRVLGIKYPPNAVPGEMMVVVKPGGRPPSPVAQQKKFEAINHPDGRRLSFPVAQQSKRAAINALDGGRSEKKAKRSNDKEVTNSPNIIFQSESCGRKSSRVGKYYQATELPLARIDSTCRQSLRLKDKIDYVQIWDPVLAEYACKRGEDLDSFLDSLSFDQKDAGMHALHKANYSVEKAKKMFTWTKVLNNDDIPCTPKMLSTFHSAIIECRKDFEVLSSKLGKSINSCLLYYYNRYKYSDEYQDLKMYLRGESDECDVCGDNGDLLCCDGCHGTFHLECLSPLMTEVPDGDWFCETCSEEGTKKRKLGLYDSNLSIEEKSSILKTLKSSNPREEVM